MLIRIVKMTFRDGETQNFQNLFAERKYFIQNFEGCSRVTLLRDISNPSVFFTYSIWQSETHLDNYRKSELFGEVWGTVKNWFSAKPEAWSVNET